MPALLTGKHKMLAGIVLAILLIAIFYGASNYTPFLSIEGLIIVVGGSVANALLSYPREDVMKAFTAVRQLLKKTQVARDWLHRDIMQLIMWSYVVQSQDMLGLERESAKRPHDPMHRYGLDLVVTGYDPESIRQMMQTVADAEFERRSLPVTVLRNMAATAPAFGMVGTLVGMVTIMNNAGSDLANIEGGLAIAMLATLYGILMARLVCLPAADKLLQKEERAYFRNHMITEGLVMLAEKRKPFYMQDRLNSFLEPSRQLELNNHMRSAFRNRFAMAS